MIRNEKGNIIGFHYTNSTAYEKIKTPGLDGYHAPEWDDFSGLIPLKRFANLGVSGLPEKAYSAIFEGLLEEAPLSWVSNSKYPKLWNYLMGDICRSKEVVLLNFEILPTDEVYVVDRAHVENQLYKEFRGEGEATREDISEGYKKCFDSRIKANDYEVDILYHSLYFFQVFQLTG